MPCATPPPVLNRQKPFKRATSTAIQRGLRRDEEIRPGAPQRSRKQPQITPIAMHSTLSPTPALNPTLERAAELSLLMAGRALALTATVESPIGVPELVGTPPLPLNERLFAYVNFALFGLSPSTEYLSENATHAGKWTPQAFGNFICGNQTPRTTRCRRIF
jgi:hypothetical protein